MALIFVLLFLCIAMMLAFFNTKEYDSINGAFLFVLGMVVISLKIFVLGSSQLFLAEKTLVMSGVFAAVITVFVAIIVLLLKKRRKKNGLKFDANYVVLLLFLYIIFGFFQQVLFQFVFAETMLSLTGNHFFTAIAASVYYGLFHIKSIKPEFVIGTFIMGFLWSSLYLSFGNLFWIGISHGIAGTIYYINLWDKDVLREKLEILRSDAVKI